jgi:hypothetical protein
MVGIGKFNEERACQSIPLPGSGMVLLKAAVHQQVAMCHRTTSNFNQTEAIEFQLKYLKLKNDLTHSKLLVTRALTTAK